MRTAEWNGLLNGLAGFGSEWDPWAVASRGETALILHRLRQRIAAGDGDPADPPASPVRLVFVHHSTGQNWLADGNGTLGIALRDNNYIVSDTNYGWGPDGIGSLTDIGHWWLWFRGPSNAAYTAALYAEDGQHSSYSRTGPAGGGAGENEIVVFKSCFPNSALRASQGEPPAIGQNPLRGADCSSAAHTVANAQGIYIDLLEYFRTRPDKLFVVVTAPPLSDPSFAANARLFNNWLVYEWLDGYEVGNVFVFDFFNVLTTNGGSTDINDLGRVTGNHHRLSGNGVEHATTGDDDAQPNVLEYPSSPGDDHPSRAGNLKATSEFVPLLNRAYHLWKGGTGSPDPPTEPPPVDHDQPLGANVAITFPLFPADSPWRTDISGYPVHPNSARYVASIGLGEELHPDFGTVWNGAPNGIPYVVVDGAQPKVPISFYYADESDPGPYPIPPGAPIEGGPNSSGDRHVLVLDAANRLLYEVYDAHPGAGGWEAGSGAVFDLTSNALRPEGWTSADAAGLPILPGLVRYDEVASGEISHALRMTASRTQTAYIHPATHQAGCSSDPALPPMGLRLRLRADYDISAFPGEVQVILQALKTYGAFIADNGASWYISGAPDPRWDDEALHELHRVPGSAFEAVYTAPIVAS